MARWLVSQTERQASDDDEDDADERAAVDPDFFEAHGIEPPQPFTSQNDDVDLCIAPEIWPENTHIVRVFCAMQTQWRMGFSGPTGLDYAVLPIVVRQMHVPLEHRRDIFMGVRVMESATLKTWGEKRRQEDARRH